jgi:acylpyruvate hydrolase
MKIICVGRNYAAHAKELNNNTPEAPILFLKPKSAMLTEGKPLYYPEFTKNLQYETELVIKISKNGKHIQAKHASKYYDSLTLGIDFTARDIQNELKNKGLPWELAKAFDGSAVVGTFLPISEFSSIQQLNFELKVNDEVRQIGNTSDMLFAVNEIIAYASQYFTLHVGDLIFTGTPEGVGAVNINDVLEGSLEGKSLLHCTIK